MSKKIATCISFAGTEFLHWMRNPRMILFAVFLVYMHFLVIAPMFSAANQLQAELTIFEPFLAVGNNSLLMLLFPLFFIVLTSDFPREGADTPYQVCRIGRRSWLVSQMGALFFSAFAYVVCIFACCGIISLLQGGIPSLQWSSAVTYATSHVIQAGSVVNFLPSNIYFQLTQPEAICYTLLLLFLNCGLSGSIQLLAAVFEMRRVGILFATGYAAIGMVFVQLNSSVQWIFPSAHYILKQHFTAYFSTPIMPLSGSITYYLTLILLLSGFAWFRVPYHNFICREVTS